jgi:branched-chain amino acid transport system substrate-binding protein
VKHQLLVGLTSSSSMETLQGCAQQAENMIIPTSYAPINEQAKFAATQTAKFKGSADLHSMAAWENVFILKQVMESEKVSGDKSQLAADRRKIRDGLAKLKATDGLIGVTKREEREAEKPYVFVVATKGEWKVLYNPSKS